MKNSIFSRFWPRPTKFGKIKQCGREACLQGSAAHPCIVGPGVSKNVNWEVLHAHTVYQKQRTTIIVCTVIKLI